MTAVKPQPLEWQVDGLTISGLGWGDPAGKPLLALHGWLDNAASFNEIAPLLTSHYVVAIDLTGHGQSSRRSADASYQIWDDLPQILAVVTALGWSEFAVLGHSRGAIIGSLLTSARPEQVIQLVLLDAVAPEPMPEDIFASQMARFLDERNKLMTREERVLDSVEDAIALRQSRGLSRFAAETLVPRSLLPAENGFVWTNDPRLNGASALKLTEGHIRAALAAVAAPVLLLLAQGGHGQYPQILASAEGGFAKLTAQSVAGSHHFHIDGDVPAIANIINDFLQDDTP
ncbi:MAG: alpha/beta fold hydrolase [Halieaceae bacterium]